ncbi:uncharacterized protein YacL [Erwinia toletana]|uniref:Uncharacterized protein YacL n=1 Tax=Winslowiella toletana TaxID=92490 RepID=A0ABS4P667_9GAMM|nr:uncharacterized protein YacL [Winslowiella toletana]
MKYKIITIFAGILYLMAGYFSLPFIMKYFIPFNISISDMRYFLAFKLGAFVSFLLSFLIVFLVSYKSKKSHLYFFTIILYCIFLCIFSYFFITEGMESAEHYDVLIDFQNIPFFKVYLASFFSSLSLLVINIYAKILS